MKTVLGICFTKKESAMIISDSNHLYISVQLCSPLIVHSNKLLMIQGRRGSNRISVRTLGVMPLYMGQLSRL